MKVIGSGKSTGGDAAAGHEWMLKPNTIYILIMTNQATGATNETNMTFQWYEHTNKN